MIWVYMAILVNKKRPFGSKVSIVETDSFIVTISTAKEGIFKGLSTMITDGLYPTGRACAKLIYTPSLLKKDRIKLHDLITETLNELGDDDYDLKTSIQAIIDNLKEKGVISEAINIA